jgi:hypothetical protein
MTVENAFEAQDRMALVPRVDDAWMAALAGIARIVDESIDYQYGATNDHAWLRGRCNICDHATLFLHVPGRSVRESFVCSRCFSTARHRAMARGVLIALSNMTGEGVRSFAAGLPPQPRPFDILDTQIPFSVPPHAGYQLPSILAAQAGLRVETSQFKPAMPWGARLGPSTTNQNLECLTFADTSFDIVLASDVMEHVRLYNRAHSEIRRILRPGGYYIFTVPHTRAIDDHVVRVAIHAEDDPARDEYLLPPEYHGSADPDEQAGVLSYRCFGRNLDRELIGLGFDVFYHDAPEPSVGIFTSEVFICRRL